MKKQILNVLAGMLLAFAGNSALAAEVLGVVCETPPPEHCDLDSCGSKLGVRGNVTDPDTGRSYFLDYPCDLAPGEDVVFILNIHGAGSIGNWQRHYFPAMDLKEQYRLVVATPTAEGGISAEGTGVRVWAPAIDDVYEPYIRFRGQPGEQATMFFLDPSGNALEFKAFRDIEGSLFAK